MALGRVLALGLLCHGVIAGPPDPGVAQTLDTRSAPRKLHGRFLHITDIHPDEYYKVHSSTDEEDSCHRGKGPAGPYGAETSDCDTPFSLVNATFDWIDANLKDSIDFVVWTGDSARHDRDEELPRNADQVLGTNTWIADKFVHVFSTADGKGMTIPVVPTFGNNDILPHNILLPGPNKWFQQYAHIWRHFIPEEQRHSFEFGGWFHVDVIPNKLAVFSLNTLYFFDRNAGVDGCANPSEPGYKQLEWLKVQLQFLRDRGMKAILMGHVPPARTESKTLWDETCWQKYTLWLHQFRDVVVAGLYGHMNIDHFLIHDKNDINIAALSGSAELGAREAMQDELSVQSASDYLLELRNDWAKLTPPSAVGGKKEVGQEGKRRKGKGGKRRKGKKREDIWGERYHVSLVGPSVVTFFLTTTDNKDKKDKKDKPKKPPHDPNLLIPAPPSKSTPPGPAYSPQPLTLTGYTQYFANLTHINNLTLTDPSLLSAYNTAEEADGEEENEGWLDWLLPLRWRRGKHGGRKPVAPPHPGAPHQPREFAYEVEYSTFDDRIYKLGDLRVASFVELAVRIGERVGGKKDVAELGAREGDEDWEWEWEVVDDDDEEDTDDDDDGDSDEDDDDEEEESDDEVETETKGKGKGKGKGKKGKKGRKHKKKKKKQNKTWLHFLQHAFVGTLEKDELKELA
ncbi:hypothetical protein NEMBOFW57_002145 [Staphylotrichum longicolle]|uniref:Endopolyphosphatase n=1 Tax=Staphylotrichum longicolle TaxID=669026 RepID=A0AAD4I1I2_9PEZI|nr:hypothetical protein NEMBOFW57_002145 [Staphylotrichum longicolle]